MEGRIDAGVEEDSITLRTGAQTVIEYTELTEQNLEAVHALSNKNLDYDSVPLDIFRYKTLGDRDFDPAMTVVALSDGQPCGYMMGIARKKDEGVSAAIKCFAVDAACRNSGIASEMLSRIETEAKSRGAGSLAVGFTRPNYLVPGVDPRYTVAAAFLLRRGFQKGGEAFNMDVDLSTSDWSTAEIEARLAKDNTISRRLRPDEKERLREWMQADGFSEGWQYQVLRAADQDPVAVFIAEKEGEIVAFSCYDGVRPGWFGPMGTTGNLRGGGIGTVTFLQCLQSMKAVGYKVCEINSVGPLYFYSKVANAVVSRLFWQFSKKLD